MNKILLLTVLDKTGYGIAAQNWALALSSVNVDVVCRHVQMSGPYDPISPKINEFVAKDLNNVDTVLQFNLPSEYCYKNGVLNVGSYAYETDKIPPRSNWRQQLELMDRIIVPCNWQKDIMPQKLKNKTWVVPYALDIEKYDRQYDKLEFGLPRSTYKFYTISEFTHRKNIPAILTAYYSSFDDNDDVALIVKTHLPNRNPGQTSEMFKQTCDQIKGTLGRFRSPTRYPKVILISSFLKEEQINALHESCDCFVTASHGESFCYPAIDSLGFGNNCIVGNHTSFKDIDYLTKIPASQDIITGVNDSVPNLYTCSEKWYNIKLDLLSKQMLESFKAINKPKYQPPKDYIKEEFNYKVIGEKLKGALT